MPPIHTLQGAFNAGEITPELWGQTNFVKYQAGLKKARNFLIKPTGGAYNRAGFRYIATAKNSDYPVRLVEFRYSTSECFVIELGQLYARFYYNGGQVLTSGVSAWAASTAYAVGALVTNGGTTYYCQVANTSSSSFATDLAAGCWYAQTGNIYEIPTPWSASDLALINFFQSADTMYFLHSSYPIQTLVHNGPTNWVLSPLQFTNGPFLLQNTVTTDTLLIAAPAWAASTVYAVGQSVTESGTTYLCTTAHTSGGSFNSAYWLEQTIMGGSGLIMTSTLAQFVAGHVGSLWNLQYDVQGEVATDTLDAGGATGTMIQCGSSWSIITTGSWTGTLLIQVSADGGLTWTTLQTFSAQSNANYNTSGETGYSQCLIRVATVGGGISVQGLGASSWSGSVIINLSSNGFTWNTIVQVTAVNGSTQAVVSVVDAPDGDPVATMVGDTTATYNWAEGAWSTYRGWPGCGCFCQDRFCVANSPSNPDTVWMSQSSSYADFGVSDPSADSDSISSPLPSQQLNAVQALSVPRDLIAVTTATDYCISSSSGVITPSTITLLPQGQRGSSNVQPIIVGLRMIIIQPMGTIVRDLAFSIYTNSYDGNYLSLQSNHLFTNYQIVDMRYQQEPDSIAWLVRDDGVLLSMTYMPEQTVVAWTWHDTEGEFEFISSIPAPSNGYNQLWAVVNRGGTRFIELMDNRLASSDPADQFFVDCGLQYDQPIAITGMTNASPVVVTAANHGLSNGDIVDIDGTVVGMDLWTDENGNEVPAPNVYEDTSKLIHKTIQANGYVVGSATTDTFALYDSSGNPVDGTALGAYESGGNVREQVTSVSGLDYLDGYTVAVVGNGFVQELQEVVGGQITLSSPASRVTVGLPYIADLDTLSLEMQTQGGTLQGRKVKVGQVTLRVKDSAGSLQIMQGEAVAELDDIIPSSPPPDGGLAPALFTGDIPKLPVRSGWDEGMHIWVRQSDPMPVTIVGIIPQVAIGA